MLFSLKFFRCLTNSGRLSSPFAFGFVCSLQQGSGRFPSGADGSAGRPRVPSTGASCSCVPPAPRHAWTGNRSLRERNGSRSVPAAGAEPVEALGDVTRDSSRLARGPPEPQHLKTTPVSPTESQTHHEALPSPWPDQAKSFPRGRGWPCDLGDPRSEYDEPARAPRPPLSVRGLRRIL